MSALFCKAYPASSRPIWCLCRLVAAAACLQRPTSVEVLQRQQLERRVLTLKSWHDAKRCVLTARRRPDSLYRPSASASSLPCMPSSGLSSSRLLNRPTRKKNAFRQVCPISLTAYTTVQGEPKNVPTRKLRYLRNA